MSTTVHLTRAIGVATATLVAATGLLASPAQARPLERGTINDTFRESIDDFCGEPGLTVQHEVAVTGRFQFNTRRPGTAPYYLERIKIDERFSTASDFVTIRTGVLDKDLKITDNGDGTMTITTLATGPSTLYNSAGKAIARDPGQIRLRLLIDHNDTPGNPNDDTQIGDSELVFGSTGRNDDYCAAMVAELG